MSEIEQSQVLLLFKEKDFGCLQAFDQLRLLQILYCKNEFPCQI